MKNPFRFSCAVIAFLAAIMSCSAVHSAFYAGWGTLAWDNMHIRPDGEWEKPIWNGKGPDFSLCFYGGSVDAASDTVIETLDHLRHVEWAANIKFHPPGNKTIRIQSGKSLVATDWRCPDTGSNDNPAKGDLGDIRILLKNSADIDLWDIKYISNQNCAEAGLLVGGKDCDLCVCNPKGTYWNCTGNWAATGSGPGLSKWCNFNMKLSERYDDGIFHLNNTLHEVGHKLGFDHEFGRSDEKLDCFDENNQPVIGSLENGHECEKDGKKLHPPLIFMTTPFDKDSVTNYSFENCDVIGNAGFTGFSAYDKLALRILYPEDNQLAEFIGIRVIKTGQMLSLKNSWKFYGAMIDNTNYPVAKDFSWKIDGVQEAVTPDINANLIEGVHSLEYSYQDFFGRTYLNQSQVEVLSPARFDQRMASQAVLVGANL